MGLDMYLKGVKYYWGFNGQRPKEDGFDVSGHTIELGYWRKHPDLHGYIVQTFAEGKDECQDIELCTDDLVKILAASEAGDLPHTEGFFFGESDETDKPHTKTVLEGAIKWLEEKEDRVSRSVIYRASW